MAASPKWKVYTEDNEYIASCKRLQDCAAIIAAYSDRKMTIRIEHSRKHIVFTNMVDGDCSESYDAPRIHISTQK